MNRSEINKAVCTGLAVAWLSASCLWGQSVQVPLPDNGHIAPKPVPQQEAPTVPAPPPASHAVLGDNDVLVDKLKALVFLPTPDSVDKAGTSATGIVLKGVTVPAEPGFRKLASSYLGQRVTGKSSMT